MKTKERKKTEPLGVLLAVVAAAITAAGIGFRQSPFNLLPLYISLVISFLQSRVSRGAYLLGAANAVLYTVVYLQFKLYATAAYALAFSCTIQLATYFHWKRKPQGEATIFRAMKGWQRLTVAAGFAGVWAALWGILSLTDSSHPALDISVSLLGILASVLTMLAYIEYVPVMILSQVINGGLYLTMMRENPAQSTFFIFTLYSMCCQVAALRRVMALYRAQQRMGAGEETSGGV